MNHTVRSISALFLVLFLLAIVVQWNDPDPIRWSLLYGAGAFLSAGATLGHLWLVPSAIVSGIYALGVLRLIGALPHTSIEAFSSVSMDSIQAEQVRELWGLIVCLAWSSSLIALAWSRSKRPDTGAQ